MDESEKTALDNFEIVPKTWLVVGGTGYMILEDYNEIKEALDGGLSMDATPDESTEGFGVSFSTHREIHMIGQTGKVLRSMVNLQAVSVMHELDPEYAAQYRITPESGFVESGMLEAQAAATK